MAFFIKNQYDRLVKISENTLDKDEQNLNYSQYTAIEVSDEDFSKVKRNFASVAISGDTLTFTELNRTFEEEEDLVNYLETIKKAANSFLRIKDNNTKSIYSKIETYRDYLNNFDVSTVSLPTNKSWEQYCEDNSISYVHPLQIP
jgi:hypothetical protein